MLFRTIFEKKLILTIFLPLETTRKNDTGMGRACIYGFSRMQKQLGLRYGIIGITTPAKGSCFKALEIPLAQSNNMIVAIYQS